MNGNNKKEEGRMKKEVNGRVKGKRNPMERKNKEKRRKGSLLNGSEVRVKKRRKN